MSLWLKNIDWSASAAWVQAIGSLGAISAALFVASMQGRRDRKRAQAAERAKKRQARDRAVGLALMAFNRLNTTRALIGADRERTNLENVALTIDVDLQTLAAFPTWELPCGEAMILFSSFPGMLELAKRETLTLREALTATGEESRGRAMEHTLSILEELISTADNRGRQFRRLLDASFTA